MPIRFLENKPSWIEELSIPSFATHWWQIDIGSKRYGRRWGMQFKVDLARLSQTDDKERYCEMVAMDAVRYIELNCDCWKEEVNHNWRRLIQIQSALHRAGRPPVMAVTEDPIGQLERKLKERIRDRVYYSIFHWNDVPIKRTGKR